MEFLAALLIVYLITKFYRTGYDRDLIRAKEEWRQKHCIGKNEHFVGEEDGVCDVCGKMAKLTIKNGKVVGWKW